LPALEQIQGETQKGKEEREIGKRSRKKASNQTEEKKGGEIRIRKQVLVHMFHS